MRRPAEAERHVLDLAARILLGLALGEQIRHRKPHMTRHTFATDVLDATEGDLYAVKELLAHSSTRVTEVDLHSARTRTASAVEALTTHRRGNRQTEEP